MTGSYERKTGDVCPDTPAVGKITASKRKPAGRKKGALPVQPFSLRADAIAVASW